MSNKNLLASVALFRALYDNNKDIYDLISEFVRAYILFNSKWSFNVSECVTGLKETFEFELPEAVVNTCLKKRLKRSGELILNDNVYTVTDKFNRNNPIQSNYESFKSDYSDIINKFIEQDSLKAIDQQKLEDAFKKYLLKEELEDDYSAHIVQFLIANQSDLEFKEKVNRIKEGLILYEGIKSTPDLGTLGSWRGSLLVFLDTEHLFSAVGLHGELYKKIFDEFHTLVRDVNKANKEKRKNERITLKFLEETNEEVNHFFHTAENLVEQGQALDPSKTAMISIINGCQFKSDIVEKKIKFDSDIKKLGISLDDKHNYYDNADYNVESLDTLEKLNESHYAENGNDKFVKSLKIFTKMNVLRKGESNAALDLVRSIFLTENGLTKSIAFSKHIYSDNQIPFATDIEFLTAKIWFKLSKGFGKGGTPISFDVITKAKLVLSSQLNRSVSDAYNKLNQQYENGEIDKEHTASFLDELRSKTTKPDDMSELIARQSIDFIDNDFIEKSQRENALQKQKTKDREDENKALKNSKFQYRNAFLKPLKRKIRILYSSLIFICLVIAAIILFSFFYCLYSANDTPLSIVLSALGLLVAIFSALNINFIKKKLKRFYVSRYRSSLKKALRG